MAVFSERVAVRSAMWALTAGCVWLPVGAQAQIVNYNEQIANYKDMQKGDLNVVDSVSPQIAAKARVAKALRQNTLVDAQALRQPDGTLKLPRNQQGMVIRTNYNDVSAGSNGGVRIASPQIDGNVSGNVTLYVEGKAPQNIIVLNSPR